MRRRLASRGAVITMIALSAAPTHGEPMRKQDAVPTIFARGPALDDYAAFRAWLDDARRSRAEVKLPFTVWRGERREVEAAAIGRHAERPRDDLRLDDTALGVPLVERMRQLQGDAKPIYVWLSGHFGAVFGLPKEDERTFSVVAVHGLVASEERLHAESKRGTDCLAIRLLGSLHCARGPARCEQCKAARAETPKPRLLDVCPYGDYARPVVKVWGGEHRAYDVLMTFASEEEARAFASKHALRDVDLGRE